MVKTAHKIPIMIKGFLTIFGIQLLLLPNLLAQENEIIWEPREDLNILLPESVRVYQGNGFWEDAEQYRAVYTTVDLRDENLKLRALGSNTQRETTKETYDKNNGILAINGGYFANDYSVSLLISDGAVISPGKYHDRPRGAFGMIKGEPQIFWSNSENLDAPALLYSTPDITVSGQPLQTNQAVGAGPVLLKQGELQVTSTQEGFGGSHMIRHPRSAIGFADKNTLIMMVVDGRQLGSAGVTLPELAHLMRSAGAVEAVNLDGGGSSAMIAAGEVVNIPSDIPGGNRNSLRNNASALVLSELISGPSPETYLFDTDSKNYKEFGLWKETNLVNHYDSSLSRQASTTHYNKAIYSFQDIPSKEYQLAAWWPVHEENSTSVRYAIHHSQGSDTLSIDQSDLNTSGKWNLLGDYQIGSGDSLEILGGTDTGKMQADAIRLVATKESPELPVRGDLRLAVISDLNSGLGAADYQWQVDSIIQRIPRLWNPDLVISGGDMVAGMGISDTTHLRNMWAGFEKHIAAPLRRASIPFAFTLGNHDGPRSYPLERKIAQEFWNRPGSDPGIEFVDREFFPNYYSFVQDQAFFVSWEASSSKITEENLEWMKAQFQRPEAKNAKYRFVIGHMPLYSVAQERDSRGNVLEEPERLQKMLEEYEVHTYISGHQHAFYPGKRGELQLLNTGAAGSGPRAWLTLDHSPTNTITIMDIFYEQDSVAYTTYEIKQRNARDMKVFNESILPSSMFGVNGHQIRRDLKKTSQVNGIFMPIETSETTPLVESSQPSGQGTAIAVLNNNHLEISGDFQDLKGRISKQDGLALYLGRNTEKGAIVHDLTASVKGRKNGHFETSLGIKDLLEAITKTSDNISESVASQTGNLDDILELLGVGAFYLQLESSEGSLRAQLLPQGNSAPSLPSITSHKSKNTYAVRDLEAMYNVEWKASRDQDGDFVAYTYQVSRDPDFKELVVNEYTGRTTSLKKTEEFWFDLLGDTKIGQSVHLYHRVLATDGRNSSASPGESLRLFKSDEPLDDLIEVPAPEFTFTGKIADGAGYGAQWDQQDKLWLADYRGSLIIKNKDGSDASFSPLKSVSIKGQTYSLNPLNGIGIDLDGNILVGRNRHLLKIDSKTGEGLAVWEVPQGNRAITAPRVNNKGEIYAASLFAEDPTYVLRPDSEDQESFELIRTIELENRVLSRTFNMSKDGMTLYFPDPGSPVIQRYDSDDGDTYTLSENIESTSSGSSGIHIDSDGTLYAAVRSSGIKPSSLHYRNEQTQRMWTLALPEVDGAEPRGIGVSKDGKTIIFCSWDKGGGYYRFELKE